MGHTGMRVRWTCFGGEGVHGGWGGETGHTDILQLTDSSPTPTEVWQGGEACSGSGVGGEFTASADGLAVSVLTSSVGTGGGVTTSVRALDWGLVVGGGWLLIQSGLFLRKILLCTPTCLQVLVCTALEMAMLEEGPNFSRASIKRACSSRDHSPVGRIVWASWLRS